MRSPLSGRLVAILASAGLVLVTATPAGAAPDDPYQDLDTANYTIDVDELNSNAGVHPRLLMDADELASLRVDTDEHLQQTRQRTIAKADAALAGPVPVGVPAAAFSTVTDNIQTFAMAYALTGEQTYLDAAVDWITALVEEPVWNASHPDLYVGQSLTALGLAYDWLYDDLDVATRDLMRARMLQEGTRVYDLATLDRQSYWNRSWLQNHMWIAVQGMATAALALFDEEPSVLPWLETANKNFSVTFSVLPPDGANHEGMDYWFYGMESMFLYADMSDSLMGTNMLDDPWLDRTVAYVLNNFLPRDSWAPWPAGSYFFGFNDGTGRGNVLVHMLRLLATINDDGQAQWLADEVEEANIVTSRRVFMDLFWYDGDVEAVSPTDADTPLLHLFDDLGMVNSRSSWEGDESALYFRAGPPLGHQEMELNGTRSPWYNWGSGHVDPDVNSFILVGNGQTLLRSDDYALPKWTRQHNTLTIDGQGQLGEGVDWLTMTGYRDADARPRVTLAEAVPGLDHIVGDGAEAYAAELGLTQFDRHLLFIKPDVLIVVDDIALDDPRQLDLRYWPQAQDLVLQDDGGYFVPGESANLRIQPLAVEGASVGVEPVEITTRYYTETRNALTLSTTAETWQSAVALSWSDQSTQPRPVSMERSGEVLTFRVDATTVTLDLATGAANVVNPVDYLSDHLTIVADDEIVTVPATALVDDRGVWLPAAAAVEGLGGTAYFNAERGTLHGLLRGVEYLVTEGDTTARIGGSRVILPAAPRLVDGRLYVPMSFLGTICGGTAVWDPNAGAVRLRTDGAQPGTDTTLAQVAIGGELVRDFDPEAAEQAVPVVGDLTIPGIVGITSDPRASFEVTGPSTLPGAATITVTSADGSAHRDYVLHLEHRFPQGAGAIAVAGLAASGGDVTRPEYVLDDDVLTYWAEEGTGRWLQFDFGAAVDLRQVAIAFDDGDQRSARYEIQTSSDAETWTTAFSGSSSGTTTDLEYVSIAPSTARYARIVGNGNSTNAVNSITSVGFFGPDPFLLDAELTFQADEVRVDATLAGEVTGRMHDLTPADLSGADFRYGSDRPNVATVDPDGVVRGVAVGTATVTVTVRAFGVTRTAAAVVTVSDGREVRVLAPTDDAYTVAWRPDAVFGTQTAIEVRQSFIDPGIERQGYLRFELGALDAEIEHAELRLFVVKKTSANPDPQAELMVSAVTDDGWSETALTAANQPSVGTALGAATASSPGSWLTFDLTEYVRQEATGDAFVSIALTTETEEAYFAVQSSEAAPAQRPSLSITLRHPE